MKMSEIKVGEEYAIGLREYEQRNPRRGKVLEVGVERRYNVQTRTRAMPSMKKANDGIKVLFARTEHREPYEEIVIARAVMEPWKEWAISEQRSKAARAEWEAQEKRRVDALNDRLRAVNQRLPEGQEVRWVHRSYGIDYGSVVVPLEVLEGLTEATAQLEALLDTGAVVIDPIVNVGPESDEAVRAAMEKIRDQGLR